MVHVIEDDSYRETRARLCQDEIVKSMASELPMDEWDTFVHEDGTPRFAFMMMANDEYKKRGGTDGGHIGAIAEAIVMLLQHEREQS